MEMDSRRGKVPALVYKCMLVWSRSLGLECWRQYVEDLSVIVLIVRDGRSEDLDPRTY